MSASSRRSDTVVDLACLEAFLPDERWFAFRPRGIHGVPHVTRVLFWSAVLAQRIGNLGALRWRELFWAASTHDLGRQNDDVDPGHGERSAMWVERHLARERPAVATLDLAFIAELCRWHEVPDRRIERLSLELLILKDADGLDRCRIHDLDPRRLRFQQSLPCVAAAEELERRSNAYGAQTAPDTLRAAASLSSWLTRAGGATG